MTEESFIVLPVGWKENGEPELKAFPKKIMYMGRYKLKTMSEIKKELKTDMVFQNINFRMMLRLPDLIKCNFHNDKDDKNDKDDNHSHHKPKNKFYDTSAKKSEFKTLAEDHMQFQLYIQQPGNLESFCFLPPKIYAFLRAIAVKSDNLFGYQFFHIGLKIVLNHLEVGTKKHKDLYDIIYTKISQELQAGMVAFSALSSNDAARLHQNLWNIIFGMREAVAEKFIKQLENTYLQDKINAFEKINKSNKKK
mgnify:CR=1 FL=1|tara:strand:- start:13388 stop:14140 length:753 start_codon:yes stop_codon:yes gene_type:complete